MEYKVKKITALFISAALLTGTHPTAAYAKKPYVSHLPSPAVSFVETEIQPNLLAADAFFNNNFSDITSIHETPEHKVTLIVELDSRPLLDIYNDKSKNNKNNFSSFKSTTQADQIKNRALNQQNKTIKKISKVLYKENDVKIKDQFTNIINAFVIEGSTEDIKTIKNLSNVKNVYIAKSYERIQPDQASEISVETGTGDYLMHAANLPYQGEGMAIAILDSGIDTGHEAYIKKPVKQKYTRAWMEKIISNNDLAFETLNTSDISLEDVFINDKIPFAYDYSDKDTDVKPTKGSIALGNDHGTHVAGIAAANSDNMKGIAPQAQLIIMKVFSDTDNLTDDSTCLAALEDCVTLDVDIINMSFGKACGYSYDETDLLNKVFNRIKRAGINMVISAGNNASSSLINANNAPLTSNPDTSTTGSPSTYEAPISVACANNNVSYEPYFRLQDGTKIPYDDYTALYGVNASFAGLTASGQELNYIPVSRDYSSNNAKGKIAVAGIVPESYDEIIAQASLHGAIGLIITNVAPLRFTNLNTYHFPIACISTSDCTELLKQDTYAFTIPYDFMPNEAPGAMYQLSSWGMTPDLQLKPEITAIGSPVYAPLPNNQYGSREGTSMASPQIAGISTVVKEYIKKDFKYSKITNEASESLVNNLLMSTATPIMTVGRSVSGSAIATAYSPRRQGAGLVNARAALNTKAVLYTTEKSQRPVLNLGDDIEEKGIYTKSFHIKNYSNEVLTYLLSSSVLTEGWISDGKNSFISETPALLEGKVSFLLSDNADSAISKNSVILAPYGDIEITATITLTENDKDYIKNHFINGEFIEGFITLTSLDEYGVDLSLPFVGFFGDWTKAPILDSATCYDNPAQEGYIQVSNISYIVLNSLQYYQKYLSNLRSYLSGQNDYLILGENRFSSIPVFDTNKIAFSPNNDSVLDEFWWSYVPLRGSKYTNYTITNNTGSTLYQLSASGDRKSICRSSDYLFTNNLTKIEWTGEDSNGKLLPNNSVVNFCFKATLDYDVHEHNNVRDTISLPITIDTEAPVLLEARLNNDNSLNAVVRDNQYVAAVLLYDLNNSSANTIISGALLNEAQKNITSSVTLKCDRKVKRQYLISITDYAGNTSNYIVNPFLS
jgi:hypothetical protein